MIFVTVGTQKFQLNRLFKELDRLIEKGSIKEEVIAQIGFSDYKPMNFKYENMMTEEKMKKTIAESNIVISHAGTSSIIVSLKMKKKVIVIPREKKFKEHVDNHQTEITELFAERGLIEPVYDINELETKLSIVKDKKFNSYQFNNTLLLNSVSDYLEQIYNMKK